MPKDTSPGTIYVENPVRNIATLVLFPPACCIIWTNQIKEGGAPL